MKRILPLLIVASLLLGGCRKSTSTPATPSPRIVSHSPAITDLLYGMELGDHVVGVTNYCMPPGDSKPAVVGDRVNVSAEAILAVKPDFVLIQQDPRAFGAVTAIRADLRIEHMTIETLDDVAAAMDRIGEITGKSELTGRHRQAFTDKLQAVREKVAGLDRPSVLLVGGYEHPFTGGKGTFVDEMIAIAGGLNAASLKGYSNWPSLNRENIQAMKPEVLICQVSPGGEAKAIAYWQTLRDLPAVRNGRVFAVTDRRWMIPSMRSAELAADLAEMIHPSTRPKEPVGD